MLETIKLYLGQAIMLITLAIIALFMVRAHSLRRRRDRKADLERYWKAFNDPDGCESLPDWFDDGMSIVASRKIAFEEVDCPGEDAYRRAAIESIRRRIRWARREFERNIATLHPDSKPGFARSTEAYLDRLNDKLQKFIPLAPYYDGDDRQAYPPIESYYAEKAESDQIPAPRPA